MKKVMAITAGLLVCSGIVFANQMGIKSLNFGAPTVKDVTQVADAHDGDIVYQKPDSGSGKTAGFWGYIAGAWIEIINANAVTPAGVISAFGGTSAPAGYLLCDGTSYNAVDYPALAQALWDNSTGHYAYGGTGTYPSGTFNTPDFRGRFLRGVDGSAGVDPDKTIRLAFTGGNSGNNVGSYQNDMFVSHSHGFAAPALIGSGGAGWPSGSGSAGFGLSGTQQNGGNETRPRNVYVNYIIKY